MVLIDDREHRMHMDVVNTLELAGVRLSVQRMDFGDYAFNGCHNAHLDRSVRVGIELSTVSDVVGKLNNDRLAFQLSNMLLCYDVSVLLITSPVQVSYDKSTDTNWVDLPRMAHACQYDRFMDIMSAAQSHGVIVLYAAGTQDVPKRLLHLFEYWSRDENSHKYFRPQDVTREVVIPIGKEIDRRVQSLMAVPTIGEERAKAALKMFGSLKNIFDAGAAGLEMIPGWGKPTAVAFDTFIKSPVSFAQLPPVDGK